MRSMHRTSGKIIVRYCRHACLLLTALAVFIAADILAQGDGDEEVRAFFQSVEESFRNKDITEVIEHIHKDFSYVMTYSTNNSFSYLESDFEKYRVNVGSFFQSKPGIHEYSIIIDDVERSGEDVMVLARVKSIVELNGIINSCDASSNYLIQKVGSKYRIKEVRGNADCANTHVEKQ